MELDIRTLQTFHKMASRGSRNTASRLSEAIDRDVHVESTKVKFVTPGELQTEVNADDNYIAVSAELAEGPGGHSVVLFEENMASELSQMAVVRTGHDDVSLVGGNGSDNGAVSSAGVGVLTEVGNMMNHGFIDKWADVLDMDIDVNVPVYHTASGSIDFLQSLQSSEEGIQLLLMFQNELQVAGSDKPCIHIHVPSIEELESVLSTERTLVHPFGYEKLVGFDEMVEQGATEAAKSMSMLTGQETNVDIRHLNFVHVSSIPRELAGRNVVGVSFTYDGLPSGYLLFVFEEESAKSIIRSLVDNDEQLDASGGPFGEFGKSALQELGNIMASGVLDGWANVLGTTIDHSPPEYIRDVGPGVADPIAEKVGENQQYAFVFDTTIEAEGQDIDCDIYSVCEEGDLETALSRLEVDDLYKARETPEFPINGVDADSDMR